MKKKKADHSPAGELRRQAEERMKFENSLPEEVPPAEAQKLIHELRVHQIELEMQNDELRQTQEILEESRSRYSDLYDFAPIGYLTLDELGIIKEVNLTAARLLQMEKRWLINRQFAHFMVLEDRAAFRRHLNLVLQGREGQTVEVRLKRKDEQEFFALLESAFYQDTTGRSLCRIAFSDISKRRQAKADLRESEARYRSLFQLNHAVMLLIDPVTGDIVDANPAASAFYGFSREELTGRNITDLNTLSPEQVFAEMQLAKKDERRQFLFRHRLARGEVRDVEVFSGPIRLQGQDLLYSIIHDITDRKQAEDALQRQKEELQIILDSVPAMIFYKDKENRFIRTNRALAVALGLPKEELDGKSLFDLYLSQAEDYYKDDLEVMRTSIPKRNIVESLETPEGMRWVQTDKIPYRDDQGKIIGVIGFSVDITERKWAEESLQATHRFLEIANHHKKMALLLEAFVAEVRNLTGCEAVGIRVLQENGDIPYEAYDGFSPEFYNLENGLCIWWDQCMCINIVKGETDPQFPYYTPGGSFYINRLDEFFCKLSPGEQEALRGNCRKFGYESMALVPIRLGGQIVGMIHTADCRKDIMPLAMVDLLEKVGLLLGTAIQRVRAEEALQRAHDELEERVKERTADLRRTVEQLQWEIEERQRAEAEILKLNEELEQRVQERTAELEAINQELDAFSFFASHDLKAPLRTIQGFSRMLLGEHSSRLDAEGLRLLNVVFDNTRIMSQLVDDLLALSRLGRQQIRKSAINLTAMANQVFQQLQSQEPERNLQLAISDLPEAYGDHNLIRQVMVNLLGNAVKYSKGRKTAEIEVGGRSEGNENIYYVKDNGSGFDARYAEKLFVAFQRLHSRQEFEGSGVGLAIVKRIIERHGGRVWAEGKVNEGATFYFGLPKNGK